MTLFEIFRFDPSKDTEAYYKRYEVDTDEKTTVIDALKLIKAKIDGSLSFRKSCGSSICGICAMKINGVTKLACRTRINEIRDENNIVKVEPISKSNLIKDLVIDETAFFEQISKAMPWLNTQENRESIITKDEIDKLNHSQECIFCWSCVSDCDVAMQDKDFLGAAAFVKGFRFVMDPRETKILERLKIYNQNGLWNCSHAYNCIDNCPKDIDPSDKIARLRELSIEKGIINRGVRHAQHFIKSLKKSGKLDEAGMALKTLGPIGLLGFIPDALRLISKGKTPALIQKKIENHDELRKLVKSAEEKKRNKSDNKHKQQNN